MGFEPESVGLHNPKVWDLNPKVWDLNPKVWDLKLEKPVIRTPQWMPKTVKTKYLNKRYKNNTKQRARETGGGGK